eukprot:GFKZ01012890.1.p1 GENE.GFKZ01012890.1~~GFKZ01012890.1.p1  ORF type:complete len:523 (+),score=63.03 GFKZ01012890.1:391-1959(+)
MASETTSSSSPVLLEQMFNIPTEAYTTGSERLDGFIIGLATMLLIRNAEFVFIDLLTFFFGNRKHKVAFRVLRTWQMLNIVSIFSLLSGFDSDIPCSRFRLFPFFFFRSTQRPTFRRFRVRNGTIAGSLLIAVLCSKLLVLSAEVAIIAFVIPSATLHRASTGLSLALGDSRITEADMQNLQICHSMYDTTFLIDYAQLTLCRRYPTPEAFEPAPQTWLPNESIRIQRTVIDPELAADAGAVLSDGSFSCTPRDEINSANRAYAHDMPWLNRQTAFSDTPDVILINDLDVGELSIQGDNNIMDTTGALHAVAAGMTPIFTDRRGMLRLTFANWIDESVPSAEPVWTLNGKLLFGTGRAGEGLTEFEICPDAIDEIVRVTGTLNAEMILDIFLISTKVKPAATFSAPTADTPNTPDTPRWRSFEIGVSTRYPLSPVWISVAAVVAVVLSAMTASLNHTEAIMARVYREQNGMRGASSPVFLSREEHVEAVLFRCEEEYHWGRNPGEKWREVEDLNFTEDAVLT